MMREGRREGGRSREEPHTTSTDPLPRLLHLIQSKLERSSTPCHSSFSFFHTEMLHRLT